MHALLVCSSILQQSMEAEDFSHHFPEKELADYLYEVVVDMDSDLFQYELNRITRNVTQAFSDEENKTG